METKDQHNQSFEGNNTIPKQNNFKIPEGYFEKLASQMEQELEISNESPKKGVLRTLAINISIAAAVVLGVFLFNPSERGSIGDGLAAMDVETTDEDAIYAEDLMLAMVASTEEWEPLMHFDVEMTEVSEEEVESVEIPIVDEVTTEDILDLFEDEDYYEL